MRLVEFLALLLPLKEECDLADRDTVLVLNPDPSFQEAYDKYYLVIERVCAQPREIDDAWPWQWSRYLEMESDVEDI